MSTKSEFLKRWSTQWMKRHRRLNPPEIACHQTRKRSVFRKGLWFCDQTLFGCNQGKPPQPRFLFQSKVRETCSKSGTTMLKAIHLISCYFLQCVVWRNQGLGERSRWCQGMYTPRPDIHQRILPFGRGIHRLEGMGQSVGHYQARSRYWGQQPAINETDAANQAS